MGTCLTIIRSSGLRPAVCGHSCFVVAVHSAGLAAPHACVFVAPCGGPGTTAAGGCSRGGVSLLSGLCVLLCMQTSRVSQPRLTHFCSSMWTVESCTCVTLNPELSIALLSVSWWRPLVGACRCETVSSGPLKPLSCCREVSALLRLLTQLQGIDTCKVAVHNPSGNC